MLTKSYWKEKITELRKLTTYKLYIIKQWLYYIKIQTDIKIKVIIHPSTIQAENLWYNQDTDGVNTSD